MIQIEVIVCKLIVIDDSIKKLYTMNLHVYIDKLNNFDPSKLMITLNF